MTILTGQTRKGHLQFSEGREANTVVWRTEPEGIAHVEREQDESNFVVTAIKPGECMALVTFVTPSKDGQPGQERSVPFPITVERSRTFVLNV